MYLMFTDETNTEEKGDIQFFIYGGLFFDMAAFPKLDRGIEKIRKLHGYRAGDALKFDTRARPAHITAVQATQAKKDVVQLCLKEKCQFVAFIIHHRILQKQNAPDRFLWAADHVIGRFNDFLTNEVADEGFVLVDNLSNDRQWRYLAEKFTVGLNKHTGGAVPLDHVRLLAATCLNSSHISSAVDIVLGTFRYCVNNPKNREVARTMFQNVVEMMWAKKRGNRYLLQDYGLILRPKEIKVAQYKNDYDNLVRRLVTLFREGA